MSKGYTDAEIEAIALQLAEHNSASRIATWLTAARGRRVTRNAIIGIVHRDRRLKAIGLKGRSVAGPMFGPIYMPARERALRIEDLESPPDTDALFAHVIAPHRKPASEVPKPAIRPVRAAPVFCAPAAPVPLLDLQPGQCKYAVNDARPWEGHLFCAEPSTNGSYCRKHHEICTGVGTAGERDASRALARIAA